MSDKKVWIYSLISPNLKKREGMEEVDEKINELKEVAADVANEGNLVVYLFDKASKYRTIEKAITNLSLLGKIYNERTFTSAHESSYEYSEIKKHLHEINKIIDKRKKENKSRRKKRND